ncbi:MAG: hypothetical protein LBD85_01335 [Oscillospiraceae bacterium]|jgi:hypothetical protein|nr:hypothetical protein [Oscillospiraceae bacterium]
MYTLTSDQFVLLGKKLDSPALKAIAGDRSVADPDAAEKALIDLNALNNAELKENIALLDVGYDRKVTRLDSNGQPYEVLVVKGDTLVAVHQTSVKEWANKITTFTLAVEPAASYFEALKNYLGFIETGDNQLLRKFTTKVTVRTHNKYLDAMQRIALPIAVKKYRRGYGFKTREMYQFNAFLFDKNNFKFTYEEAGKTLDAEVLRSGVFQMVSFNGKNLFGQETRNYYHLGMKKSFAAIRKALGLKG